jgi:ABC-type nitrate/sulfonate/bicarbonate transport system substrate-binding protein
LIAILHAVGLSEADVDLINVGYDPRLLTEGKVDVYPVFKSNEPYLIQSWDEEIILWEAADYDLPSMGLTYVTSEEILAENPEMMTRFMRAVLKGIDYAENNVDEAVQIVLKYSGPESDADHMKFMLESELVDAHSDLTEAHGIGWQSAEQWQRLADFLVEYDAMPATDAEKAFTTSILEAANK